MKRTSDCLINLSIYLEGGRPGRKSLWPEPADWLRVGETESKNAAKQKPCRVRLFTRHAGKTLFTGVSLASNHIAGIPTHVIRTFTGPRLFFYLLGKCQWPAHAAKNKLLHIRLRVQRRVLTGFPYPERSCERAPRTRCSLLNCAYYCTLEPACQ